MEPSGKPFTHLESSSVEKLQSVYARYCTLQRYVGWTHDDATRLIAAEPVASLSFESLVEDFYDELQRHPEAHRVITGGDEQIFRLKRTLHGWLRELFSGRYDEEYVVRRWRVGLKHVEIGLPQVYTAAALSRLRLGLIGALRSTWKGDEAGVASTLLSLNRLLDLDLAIMSDAYETAYVQRQLEAERRLLGDVLQREKELSAGLLEHAQAAVVILDRAGRIVRCNPYLESLIMRRVAWGLNDCDWFELFLPEAVREPFRRSLIEPDRAGPNRPLFVSSMFEVDGRTRQLHWAGVPLFDSAGQPFAVLLIGHDVTDLYDAQQNALQVERLAAIGQMATGLAHESRNALQRIGASAEMLELELEQNPAALELVRRIDQAKNHLHRLLEEVRTYAAPVVLDRSPVRLTELWREAWDLLLQQRRGREVQLKETLAPGELTVDVDRFRMVQVFRNLLDNALAAAGDPVLLEVICEKSLTGQTAEYRIRVCDNGPGMTAEQKRRIFEPFYTTKPTGTGLGTAIAKRLVESHGGTISVGEGERGTEIVITLPGSERATELPETAT